jgi:hypothetical protein
MNEITTLDFANVKEQGVSASLISPLRFRCADDEYDQTAGVVTVNFGIKIKNKHN